MASKSFEKVMRAIRSSKSREHGRGASEEEIRAAERALGLTLRGDYRRFLLELGWGGTRHIALYGLGSDVPRHLDLVSMTESERTEMHPRLRTDLVPIMNDGAGNHYCIDGSPSGPSEPPMLFWDHELDEEQTPEEYGEDFSSWLLEQIEHDS